MIEQVKDPATIPCKQCPTLAICRHKKYLNLFRECSILIKYEPNYQRVNKRSQSKLQTIADTLNPTVWNTMPPKCYNNYEGEYVYINSPFNSGYLP